MGGLKVRPMKNADSKRGSEVFDLAVLGGGSAGYAAARTAAAAGLKTVVIEGGKEVGGLCILRGCMPSKALLYAAEVLHLARKAKAWGLRVPKAGFDFKAVMARKNAMIADFANDRRKDLSAGRFQFIRAHASFVDPHTVALSHGKGDAPGRVNAKYFVVCTGSVTLPARVAGAGGNRVYDQRRRALVAQAAAVADCLGRRAGGGRVGPVLLPLRCQGDADSARGSFVARVRRGRGRRAGEGLARRRVSGCGRARNCWELFAREGERESRSSTGAGPGAWWRKRFCSRWAGWRRRRAWTWAGRECKRIRNPGASSPTRKCKPARRTSTQRAIARGRIRSSTSPWNRGKRRRTTSRIQGPNGAWISGC